MKSQSKPRQVGEWEWTATILGIAILFGVFVRVLPAFRSDFPINDGGMFLVMVRDLQANGFTLPLYTTYNFMNIPYAYPPLGFYLAAFLAWLGVPTLQVLIWLPALLTALTIPLFYFLALQMLHDRPRAALAAAFFAFAPGNYVWLLMGGGLTRSLGTVFFITSLIYVQRAFQNPTWRTTALALVSSALVVLSHPQSALLTALGSLTLGVFLIRSPKAALHAFLIGAGVLLFTLPWWGSVMLRHGIQPFFSAGQSGDLRASLLALWGNLLSRQTILPFATFFRWMGLGWVIYTRRLDLIAWGFLAYFIDQRSASIVTSFFYPMLAAYGFLDALPAAVHFFRTRTWQPQKKDAFLNQQALSLSLLGILFYLVLECFFHAEVIRKVALSSAAQQMAVWVKQNTPADSRFLILSGHPDVMTDSIQEWFPALAERHSASALQGLEWTLGSQFYPRWEQLSVLQSCRDLACIELTASKINLQYNYLILDTHHTAVDFAPVFLARGYTSIYSNEQYSLFAK
jgi:hypothetical protein